VKFHTAFGKNFIKQDRARLAEAMIHQDANTHQCDDQEVCDLMVSMVSAKSEKTAYFFGEQEVKLTRLFVICQSARSLRSV
jgi:hypothetical protein